MASQSGCSFAFSHHINKIFFITLSWLSAREAESIIEICIKQISVLSLFSLKLHLNIVILIPAWSLTVAHQRCVSCAAHPCLCAKFDINGLSWGIGVNPLSFYYFVHEILKWTFAPTIVLRPTCTLWCQWSFSPLGTVAGVSSCPSVYKSESGCVWVWLTAHCGGGCLEPLLITIWVRQTELVEPFCEHIQFLYWSSILICSQIEKRSWMESKCVHMLCMWDNLGEFYPRVPSTHCLAPCYS